MAACNELSLSCEFTVHLNIKDPMAFDLLVPDKCLVFLALVGCKAIYLLEGDFGLSHFKFYTFTPEVISI